MVDVRLETLPQDLPWSTIGRRLVCKNCGAAGSVNIVPNWHDRVGHAVRFPNVILTAHQAFFTREALEDIMNTTLANVSDFAAGLPLKNEVKEP